MNNMTAMNNMGGPVGAAGNPGPMMNNGAAGRMPPGSMSNSHHGDSSQRAQLNTYIYEYFLKNEMADCARALLASKQPINVDGKNSPRRRDDNGVNGLGDDPMDTDSKEDMKRIEDFPVPRTHASEECPDACFLFDWWCLFWDMFNGQHGKSARENIVPFINHTQHQSRLMQERQLATLRNQNPNQMMANQQYQMMMRNGAGQAGAPMNQNELARAAMANRSKATPQQMQMMQHKQQLQQNGAEMDGGRQRPQSPGSAENAPSPSKRPRLENGPFPQQGMQNGRGQPQGMPGQGQNIPSSIIQANQMLRTNNIDPNSLNKDQLQNFQNGTPNVRANAINTYSKNLSQQQKAQIPGAMTAGVSPATQGSPMMMENAGIYDQNYNTNGMGPNGGRGGPSQGGGANTNGNHALQDYQMQLMLLEQQNKKRLMMARQEQDNNMGNNIRQDGPGQQYQGASPNGPRSGASPNPNEMKRGTPQMGNAGIPGSPLPGDGQSRGSPAMNYNPGSMDPNTAPAFYSNGAMKMEGAGMGQVMPNGMRPPSSHPSGFNGQPMTQQQMMHRQQQGGGPFNPGFQGGPNGAPMMMQNPSQGGGPPAQGMNTPQQRAMPPPQAPAAGNAPNGQNNRSNTQPSSPQQPAAPPTPSQSNKAAPGKGKKNDKEPRKRPQKKGSVATLNAGATPSADGNAPGAGNDAGPATTPTPATPVTPLHPNSFKNGQGNQQGAQGAPGGPQGGINGGMNGQQQQQQAGNGQAAPAPPVQPQQPLQQSMEPQYNLHDIDMTNLDFGQSLGAFGGPPGDVLEHFDFDSFLNTESGGDADGGFNFDTNFGMEGEVGAE